MVSGGVEAECEQALKNLSAVLEAGGSTLDNVLKVRLSQLGSLTHSLTHCCSDRRAASPNHHEATRTNHEEQPFGAWRSPAKSPCVPSEHHRAVTRADCLSLWLLLLLLLLLLCTLAVC